MCKNSCTLSMSHSKSVQFSEPNPHKNHPASDYNQHDHDIQKIQQVAVVIVIFMVLELWGHFKTNSLSLLADALHLIVDISGFVVSLATLKLAKKRPNNRYTFGYQRYEILGALISVILIWVAVIYLVSESIHKILHPKEIDGKVFVGISIIGLLVNLFCVFILHSDHLNHHGDSDQKHPNQENSSYSNKISSDEPTSNLSADGFPKTAYPFSQEIKEFTTAQKPFKNKKKSNLNLRATYIHVIGDVIQSIGVIIASIIIYFYPKWVVVDIICTLFFAILVLGSTIMIVRDACFILAEGAPQGIDQNEIISTLMSYDKVLKITDLRVWSIGVNCVAATITMKVDYILIKEYEMLLKNTTEYLKVQWNIDIITIQIDTPLTSQPEIFHVGHPTNVTA